MLNALTLRTRICLNPGRVLAIVEAIEDARGLEISTMSQLKSNAADAPQNLVPSFYERQPIIYQAIYQARIAHSS